MKLVIAEKPSVAQSIAKVIGAEKREDGYLEGNGYLVSWCVGHLVELASPESYDERYEKWRYEDLPILPKDWNYQIADATRKQFGILKKLMERDDVTGLVEATDAGREGELIFRLVYHQAKCKKPFERLWISSMEDQAISDGFSNLKAGKEYDDLYTAALCRERADWIVGMNATRLFSTLYGQTLNVGRVMTPTLAMIVEREAEIEGFKPEPIYRLSIKSAGIVATSDRFENKQDAEAVLNRLKEEKMALVTKLETTDKQEKAPQLYSLTALQRDANRFLGFTAQQTLDYTQSLYEKKLVTYPRTDSRFLTEDMEGMIPGLMDKLVWKFGYTRHVPIHAKQVIDNKKVNDHHAIIPTANVADAEFGELPSGEQKVLSLITARFISALGDAAVRSETELGFTCADTVFRAKAKVLKEKGWRDIQDWIMGGNAERADSENDEEEQNGNADILAYITALTKGNSYPLQDPKLEEGRTTPKKHFTEDSLLSAMERAGAEEMPEEVERKGIGTSATRAATIEKLVRIGFVERKGNKKTKYLIPTHKGVALITVMPEQIQSPSMTAEWEQKLLDVERGSYADSSFMDEIEEMITDLVKNYKIIEDAEVLMHPALEEIGTCPCCGRHVVEKEKGYFCEDRGCSFVLWKQNRFFEALGKKMTKQTASKLLHDGKVKLKGCKSQKTGKTYDTTVVMSVDENKRAVFQLSFEKGEGKNGKSKNKKD
ncbi:DNA topoisomerase 3 [Lachnospiraceae bacterium MD1]|uniref:DNA topoisomerase n=1 Tax=Variimorphobacter saccharofermentans TaxID=2755051 RepID=A0A839JWJ5_9FIRM|nr:type IA DNA topoisomerase [Variimorphobacter saccharofermentans]MBB2181756.1 DNA topoisomerase 3 [Variimorphobacter saccharofermentans]